MEEPNPLGIKQNMSSDTSLINDDEYITGLDADQKFENVGATKVKEAKFHYRNLTALPGTCNIGDTCIVAGTFYICTAIDTWTASGGAGGSNTQIQFNDGGSFGGISELTWGKVSKDLSFITSSGGLLYIETQDVDLNGGDIIIRGDQTLGGTGAIDVYAGSAANGTNNNGGAITIRAGNSDGSADGAPITIIGGYGDITSGTGAGGSVLLVGGNHADSGTQAGDVIVEMAIGTVKHGRFNLTTAFGANSYRIVGTRTTTNATPTNINSREVIEMSADTTLFIEAKVAARRTGGSAGSNGDSAGYVRRAVYKKIGVAAPVLVGSIQDDFTVEDQVGWDCTFVVVTNDIVLQVTGAINNNISWDYEIFFQYNV